MNLPKLILASGSPRRSEILNFVGWEFEKQVADVDETEFPGEKPADYVKRLAIKKAAAVAGSFGNNFVLGADTIVVIDGEIIGKPVDLDDAGKMIRKLSGRWHEVLTGVAVIRNSNTAVEVQETRVKFKKLDDNEIEFLVNQGEPLDKAGAYAVQAQAALFIEEIEGDYWNVVGLPVNLVYRLVRENL
ncbi:MAG: septum formation inhibitor Maf [Pyrinomonadaceae bacterium]|nr:septum formation inhibitor Maf [Pyrinomonadaceae bacterium]